MSETIYPRLIHSYRADSCRACQYSVVEGLEILAHGLESVDSYKATTRYISKDGRYLYLSGDKVDKVDLSGGFILVGFGKAVLGMCKAIVDYASHNLRGGLVIADRRRVNWRDMDYLRDNGVEVLYGGYPYPDESTLKASQKLLNLIVSSPEDMTIVVLISGGGESLFEVPLDGIPISDLGELYRMCRSRGIPPHEFSIVTKHLSRVKGGKLAQHLYPRRTVSLIISPSLGKDVMDVAGGPTLHDNTTFDDAKRILEFYNIWDDLPTSVSRAIMTGIEGGYQETIRKGDPVLRNVSNVVVASGRHGLKNMKMYAELKGYNAFILSGRLIGEAREVGQVIASLVEDMYWDNEPVEPPSVLLAGGETSVSVTGPGTGGRNQELLLSIVRRVNNLHGVAVIAFNTDGVDGNSPAAGAVVDGCTLSDALSKGLYPEDYLKDNNSYEFFDRLDRKLVTGFTGTDVNDFIIVVINI